MQASGKCILGLKDAHAARILSKSGKDEARQAWQGLIEQNPDCYDYYKGYLTSQKIDIGEHYHIMSKHLAEYNSESLTDDARSTALQSLKEFSQQFPRASAPQRMALNLAQGSDTVFVHILPCSRHTRGRLQIACRAISSQSYREGRPFSLFRHQIAVPFSREARRY